MTDEIVRCGLSECLAQSKPLLSRAETGQRFESGVRLRHSDVLDVVVLLDDHVAVVRTFESLLHVLDLREKDVLLVSLVGDYFDRVYLEKSLRIVVL